jgi:hypothetical protein
VQSEENVLTLILPALNCCTTFDPTVHIMMIFGLLEKEMDKHPMVR